MRPLLVMLCLWLMAWTGDCARGRRRRFRATTGTRKPSSSAQVQRTSPSCIKAGEDPVSRSVFSGDTPLHNAAAYGRNPAVIEALVKAGANPNARNLYKRTTPLHAAAAFSKNAGDSGGAREGGRQGERAGTSSNRRPCTQQRERAGRLRSWRRFWMRERTLRPETNPARRRVITRKRTQRSRGRRFTSG